MDLTKFFDDIVWSTIPRLFWAVWNYLFSFVRWLLDPVISAWQSFYNDPKNGGMGTSVTGVVRFINDHSGTFKAVVNTADIFINIRWVLGLFGVLLGVIFLGFISRVLMKVWSAFRGAGL